MPPTSSARGAREASPVFGRSGWLGLAGAETEGGVTANPSGARRDTRVLVVDDDPDVRDLITDLLTDEGFRVEQAGAAETALNQLRERPVDVVLLDVTMPAMSGLDLMGEIRKQSEVPIIFVSAKGSETDRVLGLRMGADDYIVKPFSGPELVARIYSVLRRAQRAPVKSERMEFDALAIDLQT